MQIKNVTESTVEILKKLLYLKDMLKLVEPTSAIKLLIEPYCGSCMRLSLTEEEATKILTRRIAELEQEIRKL